MNDIFDYKEANGGITITAYNGEASRVVIPEEIDGKKVVGFGDTFSCKDEIVAITIPSSVRAVTFNAFESCSNLSEVKIADGVKRIGKGAFYGCTALETIELPPSIERIEKEAFWMSGLEYIKLNDGLKYIGEDAFCESKLMDVVMPDSVTELGKWAFSKCPLKEAVIGGGVTCLVDFVFSDSKLERVFIPKSVTRIYSAFQNCKKLKWVKFEAPDGWYLAKVNPPDDYCSSDLMSNPKKAAKCIRKGYNGKAWGSEWYKR